MKFYFAILFLGVCNLSFQAEFDVQCKVAEETEQQVQDKVVAYTRAYAEFRTIPNNSNQKFAGVEKPEGIICLFTIKIDDPSTGTRKVIKLDDDNGEPIWNEEFDIETPITDFVYKPLESGDWDLDGGLAVGQSFIKYLPNNPTLKAHLEKGYKPVIYAYFPFAGTVNGAEKGKYVFFAVVYCK